MERSKNFTKLLSVKSSFLTSRLKLGYSAKHSRILSELASSALTWVDNHNGEEIELRELLRGLDDFLVSVQFAMTPELKYLHGKSDSEWTEEERKREFLLKMITWQVEDPRIIFNEGIGYTRYRKIDREKLTSLIGRYFSCPWLRDDRLEYMFVVSLVFQDIVQFGEHIKQQMAGRYIYEKASGQLRKIESLMLVSNLKYHLLLMLICFLLAGNLLVGCLWYLSSLLFSILYPLVSGNFRRSRGNRIYNGMHAVWLALQGRVISPSFAKEQLKKSLEMGAVWDNSIYAILDLWIQRDPQMFLVDGNRSLTDSYLES